MLCGQKVVFLFVLEHLSVLCDQNTAQMATLKSRSANGQIVLEKSKIKFLEDIVQSRLSQGENVNSFFFNKSRCRVLSKSDKVSENTNGILYWMSRDCRIEDNWAMLFAQRLALKNKLPLYVCFTCYECHYLFPTKRQQQFLLNGLLQVQQDCKDLNIGFHLLNISPKEMSTLIMDNNLSGVVCDFNPLKKPQEWIRSLIENLTEYVPIVQVDAHNVIPVWETSNQQEIMARTLRPKITKKLSQFLTGFPKVGSHPYPSTVEFQEQSIISFDDAVSSLKTVWDVDEVQETKAGSDAGLENLHVFLLERLKFYGISSNDPSKNHTSNLSFWIHFGHISAQRIALEVKSLESLYKDQVEKYLEELIVRKELAENYCYYNENYDNIKGAADWAQQSLNDHRNDTRIYLYTRDQFMNGCTHDDIWNAAQLQLLKEGKIHGYMRMYWCKKILEWTETPEQAINFALWLNDTFALDGSDPNGFVGVMWSICGVHDQGWKERAIFGKIRYMVDYSLRRKFDIVTYCASYRVGNPNFLGTKKKAIKRRAS